MLDIARLEAIRDQARDLVLATSLQCGRAHTASSLSVLEILVAALAGKVTKNRQSILEAANESCVVLSKAHAALAYYSILVALGRLPAEALSTFKRGGLPAEPDPRHTPESGIPTGPLGGGLSTVLGLYAADRANGGSSEFVVVLGDGECQKGQIWEAALGAPRIASGGLVAVIDNNGLQLDGSTRDVVDVDWVRAWEAVGWSATECVGHDMTALQDALRSGLASEKPALIVARTVKGFGVEGMENDPAWHYYRGQQPNILRRAIRSPHLAKSTPASKGKPAIARPRDWAIEELRSNLREEDFVLAADLLGGTGLSSLSLRECAPSPRRLPLAENLLFRFAEGVLSRGRFAVIGVFESLLGIVLPEIRACVRAAANRGGGLVILSLKPGRLSDDGPSMRSFEVVSQLVRVPDLSVYDPRDEPELRNMVSKAASKREGIRVIRIPDWLPGPNRLGCQPGAVHCQHMPSGERRVAVVSTGWVHSTLVEKLRPRGVLGLDLLLLGGDQIGGRGALSDGSWVPQLAGRHVVCVTDHDPSELVGHVSALAINADIKPAGIVGYGPTGNDASSRMESQGLQASLVASYLEHLANE